jgi:hypothetical protein
VSVTVEDLFDAEYKLRQCARNYADGAIARNSKELRIAAVAYAKLADAFESAINTRLAPTAAAEPCGHPTDGRILEAEGHMRLMLGERRWRVCSQSRTANAQH